jgi:hypothetical protein
MTLALHVGRIRDRDFEVFHAVGTIGHLHHTGHGLGPLYSHRERVYMEDARMCREMGHL